MDEYKVAIVGFGGIARLHYAAYQKLIAEGLPIRIVAVCERNTANIYDEVKINLGGDQIALDRSIPVYTDADDMLANCDFDVADVCLPLFLHKDFTIKFLRAGKHVLCEKPMASDSDQCREMIDVANECNKLLMIGQCLRFDPHYRYLKRCIDEATFGKILYLTMERISTYPAWAADFQSSDRTGGCILDTHIHDLDMARFLLGDPASVSTVRYDRIPHGQLVNTRLLYDEVTVVVDGAWDEARPEPFRHGYHAKFENASVVFDGEKTLVYPNTRNAYRADVVDADRIAEEIRVFITTLADGKTASLDNPSESALMSVKLVERARESAAARGAVIAFQ